MQVQKVFWFFWFFLLFLLHICKRKEKRRKIKCKHTVSYLYFFFYYCSITTVSTVFTKLHSFLNVCLTRPVHSHSRNTISSSRVPVYTQHTTQWEFRQAAVIWWCFPPEPSSPCTAPGLYRQPSSPSSGFRLLGSRIRGGADGVDYAKYSPPPCVYPT